MERLGGAWAVVLLSVKSDPGWPKPSESSGVDAADAKARTENPDLGVSWLTSKRL